MKTPRIVGCVLEHEGKFVLVHRLPHKPDGDTWGLPGGKVESGESDLEAIQRELFEETGYKARPEEFELLGEYPFTSPRGDDFLYITFRVRIDSHHEVVIEETAHSEFQWVSVEEADKRDDLIHGLHKLFRLIGFIK